MTDDAYGKYLLRAAAGVAVETTGPSVWVDYGSGRAQIDAVIGGRIAVEVESRVLKQVRGALMDLLWHPFPKKLLLLIPSYIGDPGTAMKQCQIILGDDLRSSHFQVVVLSGTGRSPKIEADARRVKKAIRKLGWSDV